MSDNQNSLLNSAPSPVSVISKTKKFGIRTIMVGAGAMLLYAIFFTHHTKARSENVEEAEAPTVNVSAPQLATNQDSLEKFKSAIQSSPNIEPSHEESEASKLEKMRIIAPTTVYSVSGTQAINVSNTNGGANAVLGGNGTGDVNTQFMSRLSESHVPVENATRILHPGATLAQGAIIWATLETRIASDLPGMVRAVTSEDIYSEDGSNVLLPRGSRLVGQYTNAVAQAQERVFIIWQRVIRPDHIDIQLNSPGTDPLGAAGVGADAIDSHFLKQFGTASLLSLIGAGASNVGVSSQDQFNSASAYREALSNSFNQTAQNTLKETGSIKPTIYINQGKVISVFVARDLDFYNQLTMNTSEVRS